MAIQRRRSRNEAETSIRINAWIGVDPGKSGAACILYEDNEALFIDWPSTNSLHDISKEFIYSITGLNIKGTAIERVHAMPGQGVTSMFSFGENNGAWKMLLTVAKLPYQDPTPQQWQKNLVRKSDSTQTKHRSYLTASRLYPHLIGLLKGSKGGIKDGRCDALLIAHYVKNKT